MPLEIGDPLPLSLYVTDPATGAPAAGGVVSAALTLPDQTQVVSGVGLTITNPTLGTYLCSNYIAVQSGSHRARWQVTGANARVQIDDYTVEAPDDGIVNLADVKLRLGVRRADHDELLRSLILTASEVCEGPEGTARIWRRTVVSAEEATGGERSIQLLKVPVISLTSVTVDGVAQSVADYDLSKATGRIYAPNGGWPLSTRRNNVLISYVAGPAGPIPAGARDGTIELVRHLYAPLRGGSGIPRQEEPDYTPGSGYLVPNRVAALFRSSAGAGL